MLRKMAILIAFLVVTLSAASGQTATQINARNLLIELGSMLVQMPETEEECQALLNQIKTWQEKQLKELETPKALLRITAPLDKTDVPNRPLVEGKVADPNAKVWIIVHPMEVSDYWVQPKISVKNDGTWRTIIYIGRPGEIDVGKMFELMAVADPKVKLKEGDVLSGWPDARWKSQIIEVIRK